MVGETPEELREAASEQPSAAPVNAPAPAKKNADLGVRVMSGIVMIFVAGAALWLGGWAGRGLLALVGVGVLYEYWGLVAKLAQGGVRRAAWMLFGVVYVGLALLFVDVVRNSPTGLREIGTIILMVIGTDVGAYFAGRTFGGPKIAPRISPSKTWSGLIGGILGAALMGWLAQNYLPVSSDPLDVQYMQEIIDRQVAMTSEAAYLAFGALVAIIAQAGDFFESWMKRRAGVKDSGALIPGHGGVFDRVDGLLAVCFVAAIFSQLAL